MRSFAVLVLLTVTVPVYAQDFEAAGKHFQAAQEAFAQQRFKIAAAEFQAAYDASKDPILLYNVGEAWERAGDGHKAVDAYHAYLKAMPNATDKAEVQRRITVIVNKKYKLVDESAPEEAHPASARPTSASVPAPVPAPAPEPAPLSAPTPEKAAAEPPRPPEPAPMAEMPPPGLLEQAPLTKLRVAAWVGVATSLAFLTTGAILGLAAQSRSDEISRRFNFVDPATGQPKKFDAQTASDIANLRSDGQLFNSLGIAFYSAAAASAVATAVLFVVDAKRDKKAHALRLAPALGRNSAAISAAWAF